MKSARFYVGYLACRSVNRMTATGLLEPVTVLRGATACPERPIFHPMPVKYTKRRPCRGIHLNEPMKPLTIVNTSIRQDIEGRCCLNDLHRAAMARGKATASHRPGTFLKRRDNRAVCSHTKAIHWGVHRSRCDHQRGSRQRAKHLCDQAAVVRLRHVDRRRFQPGRD